MFDIVSKRLWFFLIAGFVLLVGIVSLLAFGLSPGIDFSAGSVMTWQFEQPVQQDELKQALSDLKHGNAIIQRTAEGDFLIRTIELTIDEKGQLKEDLTARFGNIVEKGFENVDPVIARETARVAVIAVVLAAIGILLYVTWAFRVMPKPFHYGTCAVVALLHDVVVVLGAFAILGKLANWEINLMFITGVLAVIGYSVNNVVVIFDRIRENLRKGMSSDFAAVVNSSLVETLGRCFNTSLTTLFVVIALLLIVGVSIQNFAFVLLIGIIGGTFSAICVAPTLLVAWEKRSWGRL